MPRNADRSPLSPLAHRGGSGSWGRLPVTPSLLTFFLGLPGFWRDLFWQEIHIIGTYMANTLVIGLSSALGRWFLCSYYRYR